MNEQSPLAPFLPVGEITLRTTVEEVVIQIVGTPDRKRGLEHGLKRGVGEIRVITT
jgi:hypothetical protein